VTRWTLALSILTLLFASCGGQVVLGNRPVDTGDGGDAGSPGTPDAGSGNTPLEACGPFRSATDLHVCSATHLGGPGNDVGRFVDFMPDGTIVVAGVLGGNDFGVKPTSLLGGGDGVVLRLDPLGRSVLSVTHLPGRIFDAAIDRTTNRIGVVGDLGVAVLDPTASSIVWSRPGAPDHIAFGPDGTMVTTETAMVLDKGTVLASLTIDPPRSNGASPQFAVLRGPAADVVADLGQAIVIGTAADAGGECGPSFESVYITSYGFDGAVHWTSYGWSAAQAFAADACESTNGSAIGVGPGDKIVFAAGAAKTKNALEHDAHNLAASANLNDSGPFTTLENPGAFKSAFIGWLHAGSGATIAGTWLTGRENADGTGRVAGAAVFGITTDAFGQIYAAGTVGGYMPGRSQLSVDGTPVGVSTSGDDDGFVVMLDDPAHVADIRFWVTWTKTVAAPLWSIALHDGLVATLGTTLHSEGQLITVHPIQAARSGGGDAFLSVFPGNPSLVQRP